MQQRLQMVLHILQLVLNSQVKRFWQVNFFYYLTASTGQSKDSDKYA